MKSQYALAVGIFCLAACATEPAIIPYRATSKPEKTVRVFVARHGWHTGLILPAASLNRQIPELKVRFGSPDYYEIGWGDAGFYRTRSITPGLALRAMFCSPGTVMHLFALSESPQGAFPNSQIVALNVSESQIEHMGQFISNSFSYQSDGSLISLEAGIYGESQFYLGAGRYSLTNTCNKWTAKALRSGGVKISPLTKLTSQSVIRALHNSPSLFPTDP